MLQALEKKCEKKMKSMLKKVKHGAVHVVAHRGQHKPKTQCVTRRCSSLAGSNLRRRASSFDYEIIPSLFNAFKRQVFSMDRKDLLVGVLFVFLCFIVLGAALYGLLLVLVVIVIVVVIGLFVVSLLAGSTVSVWK